MRPETPVWIRCESVGRPADKITANCTTREAILLIGKWLLGAYMGSKIRITLARSEEELDDSRKSAAVTDMMNDLESLLGGTPEPSTSLQCPHGESLGNCDDCRKEHQEATQ